MANENTITIGHTTQLNVVVYNDEPVLTFKMIDQAHARASATATFRFNDHRNRFTEGKHYHMVPYAKAELLRPYGVEVPPRGLTLITKRGYLLLVKSFTDDLAWEVQEQLVDHYFEGNLQTLPLEGPEYISNDQYHELSNRIRLIAGIYHMKESTEYKLANMLRFKLNVGSIREIFAVDIEKARAIVEQAYDQNKAILDMKIEQDAYIVDNYLCQGIPLTSTLRKQFKKTFSQRLPKSPNWRDVVDRLEDASARETCL